MLWSTALTLASSSLVITPSSLPSAKVGAAYTAILTANPPSASSYTWITTTLPDWLTFTQDGSNQATLSGTPTQAGSSSFTVQVSDSSQDSPASAALAIIVAKAVPQITWTQPSAIPFGASLDTTELDASAADASGNALDGAFSYQPAAGTVLNAGTMTLTTLFSPLDTTDYTTATSETTITVNPSTPAVAVSDVTAVFGQSTANLSAHVTFTVNSIQLPVSGGNITFSVADGSGNMVGNQLSAAVTTSGASVSLPVSGLSPGVYTYTANYVPPSFGADFLAASQSASLTINPAAPAITWTPMSPVAYNVPVTNAQLNASSVVPGTFAYTDSTGASVTAGAYSFSVVGKQQLSTSFTPTDGVDFAARTVTRNVQVLPDGTKVQLSDASGNLLSPAVITANFGDANVTFNAIVSVTTPNAGATIPTQGSVTFTVSNSSGSIGSVSGAVDSTTGLASGTFSLANTSAGTYHVAAAFGAATFFGSSNAGGTLLVKKALPTVTWPAPSSSITYGTALDATVLDASASVPGSFTYMPPLGAILKAGAGQVLQVTFRPSDAKDYANVVASVTIDVTPAATNLTVPSQAPIATATLATLQAGVSSWTTVNGGQVSFMVSGLGGKASASGNVLNGLARATISLVGLSAGSYTITANYSGNSQFQAFNNATGSLTVTKQVTPTLTWATPSAITYGTVLSSSQLDAAAADSLGNPVSGSFTYSAALGTILLAGQHQLSVLFTPTDAVNFTTAKTSVTLEVDLAATSISVAAEAPLHGATQVTLSAAVSAWNKVNGGTVAFTVIDSLGNSRKSTTATVSKGSANGTVSLSGLTAGSYAISAIYKGSAQYLASGPSSNTLTVS